jgi:hypothetical protein
MTPIEAERALRQLWAILVAARYGALTPGDEEEVLRICHDLEEGMPGYEQFNRSAARLCKHAASLKGGAAACEANRIEGLLLEVDYLRALANDAVREAK